MEAMWIDFALSTTRHASAGWHPCLFPRKLAVVKGGWVHIMSNGPSGTLYVGVTSNLAARVHQHRTGSGSDFCRRYGLDRLVYAERHDDILSAIAREKAIKAWQRAWKLNLIGKANPDWRDLFDDILD